MYAEDRLAQLIQLTSLHTDFVVRIGARRWLDERASQGEIDNNSDPVMLQERRLRERIVGWQPSCAAEAREKLNHLARFVAATGVSFDTATLEFIRQSVSFSSRPFGEGEKFIFEDRNNAAQTRHHPTS
jgi:hypothetical protein